MTTLEKIIGWVRHRSVLSGAAGVWNAVRPLHDWLWRCFYRQGISRVINGTDAMQISPRLRRMADKYEPEVWATVMRELKAGDVFVDIGAFHGLYSVAAAKRVGKSGSVVAFEPEPENFALLNEHIRLNGIGMTTKTENKAVGATAGVIGFRGGFGIESRIDPTLPPTLMIETVAIQDYFQGKNIDILKIDVEGYEEFVLRGAIGLLADSTRKPRAIYIEMHPFAWPSVGSSSEQIISILQKCGYGLFTLGGERLSKVETYGEAVAKRI